MLPSLVLFLYLISLYKHIHTQSNCFLGDKLSNVAETDDADTDTTDEPDTDE